jgi:hypothetical protein
MRHLRSAVLVARVVAPSAAPAGARDQHGLRGHAVVTRANGRLLGESTAQIKGRS